MQIAAERADKVTQLLDEMLERQAPRIALAEAIHALDARLRTLSGEPLEPLYEEVPAPLRGCVELVYDREHRASFPLYERLMYASQHGIPRCTASYSTGPTATSARSARTRRCSAAPTCTRSARRSATSGST
jgi:Diiron non-heme beta-hydroxylase N-terminal domain